MFEQAVAITGLGFSYDLAYRNCDHIALSILGMGGIAVEKNASRIIVLKKGLSSK